MDLTDKDFQNKLYSTDFTKIADKAKTSVVTINNGGTINIDSTMTEKYTQNIGNSFTIGKKTFKFSYDMDKMAKSYIFAAGAGAG